MDIERLTLMNCHTVLKTHFIEKTENGNKKIYGQIKDDIKLKIDRLTKDDIDLTKRPEIINLWKERYTNKNGNY